MSERSQYDEALQRVSSSDYNWQQGYPKGALREATVAQTHAMLAVADELRRLNEGRDQFNEVVADLLVRLARPDPGPCASLTPGVVLGAQSLPQQSCKLRYGHEGLHESVEGSRWWDHGSLRSNQPAAAPDGQEGGKP